MCSAAQMAVQRPMSTYLVHADLPERPLQRLEVGDVLVLKSSGELNLLQKNAT